MRKLIIGLSMLISTVFAQSTDTLKKNFNLFRPTPKQLMRGMETDRPDITESAYSVDAGHFQLETDLVKTVYNGTNKRYYFNLANLKIGLTNQSDLQLVAENYILNKVENMPAQSGVGQVSLRYKYNIWGNDDGKTAFALMPYLRFPNGKFAEVNAVEGGIIFPFALELNSVWGMGAQVQIDALKTENGYKPSLLQSITLARDLGEKWNAFIESYYTYFPSEKTVQVSFNGGVSVAVTPNLKFDSGFNYGITKETDKVYFLGLSFRY